MAAPVKKVKVSVNLTEEDLHALEEMAAERGITVTHALRQAIATERFLNEERKKGSKVLLEQKKKLREVVFK